MRMGKKKQPTYRIVAADARSPRNGRFIEIVGAYDPWPDPSVVTVDNERALHWLRHGAQPTDRVRKLLCISGAWEAFESGAAVPPPQPAAAVAAPPKSEPAAPAPAAAPEAAAAEPEPSAAAPEESEPEPAAESAESEPPALESESTAAESAVSESSALESESPAAESDKAGEQ